MRWDEQLARLLEDLEQQADGLAIAERDAEVAEQSRAEYARVEVTGRLHASVGRRLQVGLGAAGTVDGTLTRVGQGWCLIGTAAGEWVVRLEAVRTLRGLSERSVPAEGRPLTARLGVASALRGVAEERGEVVVLTLDGVATRGTLGRVGGDFVDLRVGDGQAGHLETVPFTGLAAVRST
jgi:hypothetical protein